jgi:hypothetical protein
MGPFAVREVLSVKGVPCNRFAVSAIARDRHDPAISSTVCEDLHALAPVTAQFAAARVIWRTAILHRNQTTRLNPAAPDMCAATKGN